MFLCFATTSAQLSEVCANLTASFHYHVHWKWAHRTPIILYFKIHVEGGGPWMQAKLHPEPGQRYSNGLFRTVQRKDQKGMIADWKMKGILAGPHLSLSHPSQDGARAALL